MKLRFNFQGLLRVSGYRVSTVLLVAAVWLVLLPVFRQNFKAATGDSRELSVAAAAGLRFAMDDIITAFRERHPDILVKVIYGSSGNFYSQLSQQAPFDIYFSADVAYPRRLIDQGHGLRETEFLYAVGRIVVWAPGGSSIKVESLGIRSLLAPSVKKIAIANPLHAPYGRVAEAAMRNLGVYRQVKTRLVFGENISQTVQFVLSRAADIGIIALSLALAPPMRNQGRYWEIPLDAYPRMDQGGVILHWAKDRQAAAQLRDFVLGPEGRAILKRYGFFLPGE